MVTDDAFVVAVMISVKRRSVSEGSDKFNAVCKQERDRRFMPAHSADYPEQK
jgi:hypothetical protein